MIKHDEDPTSSQNTDGRGGHQSPINIDSLKAIPKTYPPILMGGYDGTVDQLKLTNTGHTVEIRASVDSSQVFISGGPLKEKHTFQQLHFHWGATNSSGSEHSVDGNFFSMEAHVVHYNQKYAKFVAACNSSDGLAVVAVFLQSKTEEKRDEHPVIENITNQVQRVITVGSSVDIVPDVLARMKESCSGCGQYYTYHGSLTTSPFTENVTWIIYPNPLIVSKKQIEQLRQLKCSTGATITSNRRQTQPLGDRQVHVVTNTGNGSP